MRTVIRKAIHSVSRRATAQQISKLFDGKWYRERYRGHLEKKQDPISHWISVGLDLGFDPHPLFSVSYYRAKATVPEGMNPLIHFLEIGGRMGTSPHALFDAKWYLATYPDVAVTGINPLLHYLQDGASEGRQPNPDFDGEWYLQEYADVAEAGMNPLVHYVKYGQHEGRFINQQAKALAPILTGKAGTQQLDLSGFELEAGDVEFIEYLEGVCAQKNSPRLAVPLAENIRLVSFDIWDTLLRRSCHPDEVKLASARYVFVNHYWKLRPAFRSLPALLKARQQAENACSRTSDFEYRFSEAASVWLGAVLERGTPAVSIEAITQELIEHEFQAECRCTRADGSALALLKNGKLPAVVFASDFYMPAAFLQRLLLKNGVPDVFIKGYSSSDNYKNKRSGDLFREILQDFDVEPEELLHVGDNSHADVQVPLSIGIKVHHYIDPQEERTREWYGEALRERLHEQMQLHEQRLLAILERRARSAANAYSEEATELYQLGIRLAPLAAGMALHIIEEAKRLGADKVFFFTREGIFLREVFERVVSANPYLTSYPGSEIVEVSRLATFGPSLGRLGKDELMRMWSLYSKQSPKAFCRSLNLDTKEAECMFAEAGVDYDEVIAYPWKSKNFVSVLESEQFQMLANGTLATQKANLVQYLHAKGLGGQKAQLVVDLGWRGTIQDNIARLIEGHLHGCYLGLFGFLNAQPINSSKTGWLFDHNKPAPSWEISEVAPLEMLFNGPGGSVSSYVKTDAGEVVPVRVVDEDEDGVFHKYTSVIQRGMLDAIPACIEYIALHGLVADDLRNLSRRLVTGLLETPPAVFANSFFELAHNETFGAGTYQDMDVFAKFETGYASLEGSRLHAFTEEFFKNVRWPMGFAHLKTVKDSVSKSDDAKAAHLPYKIYKVLQNPKKGILRIGIYAPAPIIGSGGHRTIFNMARKFVQTGCEVFCFLESHGQGLDVALDYLSGARVHVSVGWANHVELDMAIATIAHSAPFVAKLPNVRAKGYLVQDYEAYFNPVGDAYTVAENSYAHGALHFTIGNWLSHVLTTQYRAHAVPAGLGIDTSVYFPRNNISREKAICFLYQPEKPRRNPTLGIEALRIVKMRHPDIRVYVYGSDAPIEVGFEVENLGLVRDLKELNALYNRCEVGLCISMSNPSRIPFEMMAAGTIPVDVYRYNNLFDYESGTIKLAYQTPDSIAEAICDLFEDEEALQERRAACKSYASVRTLEWETDVIVNSAIGYLQGRHPEPAQVKPLYNEKPVIANSDCIPSVQAFCEWQRRLALF